MICCGRLTGIGRVGKDEGFAVVAAAAFFCLVP